MNKKSRIVLIILITLSSFLLLGCPSEENSNATRFYVNGTSASMEGVYSESSYQNGKACYSKDSNSSTRLYWTGSYWCIRVVNTIYYKNTQNTSTPPSSSWTCGVGVSKPGVSVSAVQ